MTSSVTKCVHCEQTAVDLQYGHVLINNLLLLFISLHTKLLHLYIMAPI